MEMLLNRTEAGRALAKRLADYKGEEVVVYGLTRGGVVTAKAVAESLGAPLDILVTCKVGFPDHPARTLGAITDDGYTVFDNDACRSLPFDWLSKETERCGQEARRRREIYQDKKAPIDVRGKTGILVDDGVATGYTIEAALQSLRHRHPARIVVAVPVAPLPVVTRLRRVVDDVVVLLTPEPFVAIPHWYVNFAPVDDRDVIKLTQSMALR
ncbi:MAG: phosphoribosyltransferase [Fimbriimonas sp.]